MGPGRDPKAFMGEGWAFPFRLAADGQAATARHEEDIAQSIRIILGTNRGERVMRPEFGAGLEDFLFEPISAGTLERVRRRVEEALIDFEPRIDVMQVEARPSGLPVHRIDIAIDYRVRSSNTLHNLVYPFYLEEGAEPGGAAP